MPSKLEMLLQLVKAKKGAYGAQRVERAADEIKNLEKLYSQEALQGAFLGDNAKALMSMRPENFENYARKLPYYSGQQDLKRDEYIKNLSKLKSFSDVPFLEIDRIKPEYLPNIAGHEGRHRSRALEKKGVEKSLVQLLPRAELREPLPRRSQEEYIEALRKEIGENRLVTPEGAFKSTPDNPSGTIELPEIYKQGGKVSQDAMHMAVMNQKVQKKAGGGDLKRALELWNIAKGTRAKAAQEAAGLYHPIGGGVKLQTPVPFMEFKTIEDPTIKKAARKIISPEQLQGGIAIPLVGDRAAAGRILTDIGGQKLARPVTLEGGPEYMLTHTQDDPSKSAIWASDKGVISGLSKQAKIAGESGRPVYGVNVIGSPTNVDYNTMTTQTFLGMLDPSSLTKKVKKEFTRELRNYVPDPKKPHNIPGKNFVGFDDIDAMREQLLAPGAGELRKAFLNRMGIDKFKGSGLPDVAHARLSVTEPSLLDDPLGSAGFTIARMDPEGKVIEEPVRKHGTYSTPLGGQYEGSLERVIPYKQFFPSFEEKRRLFGASPASDYRSFSLSPVFQELNQEWLDTVMKSLGKDKPSVSEFKDGGVAHMKNGDLVEDLIRESKQELPSDPFAPKPVLKAGQSTKAQKTIEQMRAEVEANRRAADILRQDIQGIAPREGSEKPYAGRSTLFPEGVMRDVAEAAYRDIGPSIVPAQRQWTPSVTIGRQPSYVSPVNVETVLGEAGSALDMPSKLVGEAAFRATGSPALATAAAYGPGMIGPEGYVKGSKALANEAAYRIHQAMTKGEGPLAGALAGIAPRPLITWHGSPHIFSPDVGSIPEQYKKVKAGEKIGDLSVGEKISNYSSIEASGIDDVLPGVRAVPMSSFEVTAPSDLFYAADDIKRVKNLAEEIKESGRIDPLIVGVDERGNYIIEGAHRLGALHLLGAKEFPAIIARESGIKKNPLGSFDPTKIGTGEGAQAYGHGHYLAEVPETSKSYIPRDYDYEAKLMQMYKQAEKKNDVESMTVLESAMIHQTPSELLEQYPDQAKLIEKIRKIPQKGSLYKVDLPDEAIAKMLDWDKPLSEQSQHVKDALEKGFGVEKLDYLTNYGVPTHQPGNVWNRATGRELLEGIGREKNRFNADGSRVPLDERKRYATDVLKTLGIPGIRYLDGGSRAGGKGTSNFVVFDDKIPKIIGRE